MSRQKRHHRATRATDASPSAPVSDPPDAALRWRDILLVPSTAFGLVLLLLAAGCPVQLARWEAEDRRFATEGRRVDGVVTQRWYELLRSGRREYLTYEFRAPSGQVLGSTHDVPAHLGEAPVGSRIVIEYLPSAPSSHRPYIPGATPDALRPSTLFWLCVVPGLLALALLRRGWRQAHHEHRYGEPWPDLRVRDAEVVYDAGRQLPKVRGLMWLALASGAGGLLAAWNIAVPASGGQPTAGSVLGGVLVGALSIGFPAGMQLYARHYVAEWRHVPGTSEVVLTFPGLIGSRTRRYQSSDLHVHRRHAGRATSMSSDADFSPGITVDAPWYSLRVPDRRWPLILDAQGWFRDKVKP